MCNKQSEWIWQRQLVISTDINIIVKWKIVFFAKIIIMYTKSDTWLQLSFLMYAVIS